MNAQLQVDVTSTPSPTQSSPEVTAVNLKQSRRDLLRGIQAVIQVKAQEERGVATAVGRKVRWEYVSQVGRSVADSETGTVTSTGNSANAQQVAENEAKKVCVYYQQLELRLSTHTSNNQLI